MSEPDLSYIHESLQHIAIPIADLTPDPKNARKHDRRNLDAIKASLDRFGMRSPIVVQRNGDKMTVRAGNGRVTAALELGWSHLPATVFEEDDNEAVAFAVADNRSAELAAWDWENLAEALDTMSTQGVDIVELGWSAQDMIVLFPATPPSNENQETSSPPDEFSAYDDNIETEHACPRCGYAWSGKANNG